jgi:hypothetical protein
MIFTPHCWVLVERGAQLRVDRVARGQRVVQVERADDVSQGRERELLDAPPEVLHLVRRPHRVGDHEVDDGVHLHRDVVARDDGLGLDLVIRSRRSVVARTESRNGTMMFNPASARLWKRPSRSISFTDFWGTTLIDFASTMSAKRTRMKSANDDGDAISESFL